MLRTSCRAVVAVSFLVAPLACGGSTSSVSGGDGGGDSGNQSGSGSGSSGGDSGVASGSGGSGGSGSGGGTGSSGGQAGGSGSGGGSSSSSGGSSGSDGGQGACATDAQCGSGSLCGFRVADGCSATGTCFLAPGVVCDAYSPACACDGSEVNAICNGLPSGYATKPVLHSAACSLLEAGASCTSDTQCDPGLKCCYPCRAPGCSNECVTATASGECPPMPP